MAFIEWQETYSVGLPEIDTQHRRLLSVINQLHDAMKMGGKAAALETVMNELVSYTRYHFAYEERLMEAAGYAGLAEHRRRHSAMVAQVESFQMAISSGHASVSLQLMAFLKSWLTRHILETDMRYAGCLGSVMA